MIRSLFLTFLAFTFGCAPVLRGQSSSAPAAPAGVEKPFPVAVLERATHNMARLTSYHISAVIDSPGGRATLEADLGVGTLSMRGQDPKGNVKLRIAAEKKYFLSLDEGATWKTGEKADSKATVFLSTLVLGPVSPSLKLWEKGEFEAKEVEEGGETLLLVGRPATTTMPEMKFWLVREPSLGNEVLVRKAYAMLSAVDGDFPVLVTYTKFNVPVTIKPPVE